MKSSSLGARLFEGLVQPILGTLWNSPPAASKDSVPLSTASNNKQNHSQRPSPTAQLFSSSGENPAMRGSALYHQTPSCGNVGMHAATTEQKSTLARSEPMTMHASCSGGRNVNAATLRDPRGRSAGTASGAEGVSRKPQTRATRRQTTCRLERESCRASKRTSDSLGTIGHTRCRTIRHGAGNTPAAHSAASVALGKLQRFRQQRGPSRIKPILVPHSASSSRKQGYLHKEPHTPIVEEAENSQKVLPSAVPPPQRAPHTLQYGASRKWNAIVPGMGGIEFTCGGQKLIRNNNGGPHSSCQGCNISNTGSDCSSSSSWCGDDCVAFPSGKSTVCCGSPDNVDLQQGEKQTWPITRQQASAKRRLQENHHRRPSKQQLHQQQRLVREVSASKFAASLEGPRGGGQHTWQSAAVALACMSSSIKCSCPADAPSSSSSDRLQCSDTTTTCSSSSSMTTCGDALDTARRSATAPAEDQQQCKDIEEEMPLAFPALSSEDSQLLLGRGPYPSTNAHNKSHAVCTTHPFPLEAASVTPSFSYVNLLVAPTSSNFSAESRQCEINMGGFTAPHPASLAFMQGGETSRDEASAPSFARDALLCNTSSGKQFFPVQSLFACSSVVLAPLSTNVSVNLNGRESQRQSANARPLLTQAHMAETDNAQSEQQHDPEPQRQPEQSAPASVVFGHRVLKPLRSKCLEENYDALIEIVAFTKRRCERETMELLRKDIHILYYARGLHHAAHVETYLRQQQTQQKKQQQELSTVSGTDNGQTKAEPSSGAPMGGTVLSSSCANQPLQSSSETAAAAATNAPPTDKRSAAVPCFPSVSAALASGARPQAVPMWATPEALREALERQQGYDPFSIFGEAPPELLLSEVYDEQHYTHISPQTRASHPVLARLKQQRRAALMAAFQQRRAALARTQQLLQQEVRQLQRQQRAASQQHQAFVSCGQQSVGHSSVSGGAVAPCSSEGGTLTILERADARSGKDGKGSLVLSRLGNGEGAKTATYTSNKDKERMLQLQRRDVVVQQQLLDRRLEEQLQQEERIYGEILCNGFRFLCNKASGGESGAAIFRKWVLPALESWWQQQCQVELDWRNDPLTSEECSWYREVMNASIDASDLISVQQACFCPTPPPYRQWTWTDCRVRQRQQHEQTIMKLTQEQEIQHKLNGDKPSLQRGSGKGGSPAEKSDAKEVFTACADDGRPAGGGGEVGKHISLQRDNAGERSHDVHAREPVAKHISACRGVANPIELRRKEALLKGRTPSRRGRKRRAKEDDCTPHVFFENNAETARFGREVTPAINSGSARKRPRSFSRQVRSLRSHQVAAERSQSFQTSAGCCSSRFATCYGGPFLKENILTKQQLCPTSVAPPNLLITATTLKADCEAGKIVHAEKNAQLAGAKATIQRQQQPQSYLTGQMSDEGNSSGPVAALAGTCNMTRRDDSRDLLASSSRQRDGDTFLTPVSKLQALNLSQSYCVLSGGPLQQVQPREKTLERSQQQLLRPALFVPPNTGMALRRVASPRGQHFFPSSSPGSKTAPSQLISSWRGSVGSGTAMRLAWEQKVATAEAKEATALTACAGLCCSSAGGEGHRKAAVKGRAKVNSSISPVGAKCRPARALKSSNLMSGTPRRPKHVFKYDNSSARAAQESCLPGSSSGVAVHVATAAIEAELAAGARGVATRKLSLSKPMKNGLGLRRTSREGLSSSKTLHLLSSCNVRPTMLLGARRARLSVDRVYGCRRGSDFLHSKLRSQFAAGSLICSAMTCAVNSTEERRVAGDKACEKNVECNHEPSLLPLLMPDAVNTETS